MFMTNCPVKIYHLNHDQISELESNRIHADAQGNVRLLRKLFKAHKYSPVAEIRTTELAEAHQLTTVDHRGSFPESERTTFLVTKLRGTRPGDIFEMNGVMYYLDYKEFFPLKGSLIPKMNQTSWVSLGIGIVLTMGIVGLCFV